MGGHKLITPGRVLAFFASLAGVYYAWGLVFSRTGTGSNVVLGLLMGLAALYLVTTNLGAFLDDVLFTKGERETNDLVRNARSLLEEGHHALARAARGKKPRLGDEQRAALQKHGDDVRVALDELEGQKGKGEPPSSLLERLKAAVDALEHDVDALFGKERKGSVLAQARSLGVAFAIALALRAFVVEPFQIPSSSMIPTLLIGDHLFVARFWYGLSLPFMKEPRYLLRWSLPEPGDVVVFVAPPWVGPNAGEDWIKRVIAGQGQTVKMRDGVVHVDGQPYELVGDDADARYLEFDDVTDRWHTARARHQRERVGAREHSIYRGNPTRLDWPSVVPGMRPTLDGLDCTENECRVKEGFVFVMGDNRDNSSDGRVWGAVPVDNVKGRALFIWMSVDGSERSVDLGRFTLPKFRWERLFDGIE